jgi:hypothetical protein
MLWMSFGRIVSTVYVLHPKVLIIPLLIVVLFSMWCDAEGTSSKWIFDVSIQAFLPYSPV